MTSTVPESSPRLAMCIEQTLGHRTHGLNLQRATEATGARVDLHPIEFPERTAAAPLPWALRGSLAACARLRHLPPYDATFFHTQTIALFAPRAVRGRPYVISVDATPLQYDEMGQWYDHGAGGPFEATKRHWYRSIVRRAAAVVAWSQWAASSLVEDYDADPARILVAHPGASQAFFAIERPAAPPPVRARPTILFVGGAFDRKGGPHLLEAFEALRDRADLVLVTGDDVRDSPGVRVVRDVRPGSRELLEAFAAADLFCLPTLGDCTPVVIGEAMAAGLPVVTTDIASNSEWVADGTGLLVPPGDVGALRAALGRLVDDAPLRRSMGLAARANARTWMDADLNAGRIIELLTSVAHDGAMALSQRHGRRGEERA